jgi:hypothetical protein
VSDETPHVALGVSDERFEGSVIAPTGSERQLGGVRVVLGP